MALPIDQQPSQVGTYEKILTIANRIMNGGEITKEEAIELIHTSDDDTMILLAMADKIRQHFNDNSVDVCAIVNARSGKCPENCVVVCGLSTEFTVFRTFARSCIYNGAYIYGVVIEMLTNFICHSE